MGQDQLDDLLSTFVTDLGATITAGNVRIGDRLGLYRALAEAGPLTPDELAAYTGTAERYVRQWLAGHAAGGYVCCDGASGQFWLNDAQALAFADPTGLELPGAFQLALACLADEGRITQAFRTGDGVRVGRPRPRRVHRLRAVLPTGVHGERRRHVDHGRPRRPAVTGAAASAERR